MNLVLNKGFAGKSQCLVEVQHLMEEKPKIQRSSFQSQPTEKIWRMKMSTAHEEVLGWSWKYIVQGEEGLRSIFQMQREFLQLIITMSTTMYILVTLTHELYYKNLAGIDPQCTQQKTKTKIARLRSGQCQTCRVRYSSSSTLTNRRAKGKSSSEYARQHAELRDVQ
jgi:hypothetical protein